MANSGIEALSSVLATYQNGGNITQLVANIVAAVDGLSTDTSASLRI